MEAFLFSMLPLGHIIHVHNISIQLYADDIQFYVSLKPNQSLSCFSNLSFNKPLGVISVQNKQTKTEKEN